MCEAGIFYLYVLHGKCHENGVQPLCCHSTHQHDQLQRNPCQENFVCTTGFMIDNARNTYIEISQLTILVAAWHRANTTYFGSIQICIDRFHSKSGSERFVTQNVMCGKKKSSSVAIWEGGSTNSQSYCIGLHM